MTELERTQHLTRQLPLQRLKMTPWDYIRYFRIAAYTYVWERGRKILKWIGVEL